MQTKLIKLTEGYIIVSDINIQDKDIKYILSPNDEINTFKSFEIGIGTTEICWIKVKETTTLQQVLNSQKIIASNFIPELPNIDFNNLEEEFGIIEAEILSKKYDIEANAFAWIYNQLSEGCEEDNNFCAGVANDYWIHGFNKSQELNKDKLIGNQIGSLDEFLLNSIKYSQEERESIMDAICDWLELKTEWNIEIEHTCKSIKREGESCTLNNKCTYPNCGQIKITKIL